MNKFFKKLKKFNSAVAEETGASELVVICVIIVVVLVVAVVFKNQLINIVNAVGNKVINWINGN